MSKNSHLGRANLIHWCLQLCYHCIFVGPITFIMAWANIAYMVNMAIRHGYDVVHNGYMVVQHGYMMVFEAYMVVQQCCMVVQHVICTVKKSLLSRMHIQLDICPVLFGFLQGVPKKVVTRFSIRFHS